MVLGKTTEQRRHDRNLEIIRLAEGVRCFAWLPDLLADGRRVWLQHYWRYYKFNCAPGQRLELRYLGDSIQPSYTAYLDQSRDHIDGKDWRSDTTGAEALDAFKKEYLK